MVENGITIKIEKTINVDMNVMFNKKQKCQEDYVWNLCACACEINYAYTKRNFSNLIRWNYRFVWYCASEFKW